MYANDVSFDVATANSWKTEAENELQLVDKLLKEVGEAVQVQPGGEQDTIMSEISVVGTALTETWSALTTLFEGLVSALTEIIFGNQNTVDNVVSGLEGMKSNIHR